MLASVSQPVKQTKYSDLARLGAIDVRHPDEKSACDVYVQA